MEWEQWGGIIERGFPQRLVLERLNPEKTERGAPGPGAMNSVDWKPLAKKYLENKRVILHTDGARAYKMKAPGV